MPDSGALEANIARIPRDTLADRVYADLTELVLAGRFPPGEKLTLRGLAAALGTSPMPVRDAVGRLVSDKALEMLPNRTVQVSWPSRERFDEIVLIRCNLEGLASELAATRRSDAELSAIRRHAEIFEELADRAEAGSPRAIEANRLLHFAVYDAARSPMLREMIGALWLQIGPVLALAVNDALTSGAGWWHPATEAGPSGARAESAPYMYRWHRDLVAALVAGDGEAARRAVVGDITDGAAKIIESGHLSRLTKS